MQAITFPKDAFRANIAGYMRQYDHGIDASLFRELLQNSRDAGATRVDITLTETDSQRILKFRDNGKGMDWSTLNNGMLTYGGSIKEFGNAGGFGMAKIILCFASDRTEIRTREHAVAIDGIQWEKIESTEHINGCEFTIFCSKSEEPTKRLEPTEQGLKYLLSRCCLNMEVYFNGESMDDMPLDLNEEFVVKEFDKWKGKAYAFKGKPAFRNIDGTGNCAVLLHRGIWVNDIALASDSTACIVINTDADAKKVLNDTRIRLAYYDYSDELEKWLACVAQGEHSVLKSKKFVQRFDGELHRAINTSDIVYDVECSMSRSSSKGESVIGHLTADQLIALINHAAKVIQGKIDNASDSVRLEASDSSMERLINDGSSEMTNDEIATTASMLVWKPAYMIANEIDTFTVPEMYYPSTMGARVKVMMTIWSEMIKQFLIFRKEFVPFGVGVIFSDDTGAMYRREKDGTQWFLINLADDQGSLKYKSTNAADRGKMIMLAAHEVAHLTSGGSYHSDTFVMHYDRNIEVALNNMQSFNSIWKKTR